MHRVYVKFDGTNDVRFNWPDDPVGKWTVYENSWSVSEDYQAMCLIDWLFDANGYTDVLYSQDWEFIVIEEDHDN